MADGGDDLRPKRGRSRLCTASLVLNLFLVGLIVGFGVVAALGGWERPEKRTWGLRMEMETYEEALPERYREEFRENIMALLPEARERWGRLRELRGEVAQMLTEPEPDREAIDSRLSEIRRISTEVQIMFQDRAFDTMLSLPPEVREDVDITFPWHRDRDDD